MGFYIPNDIPLENYEGTELVEKINNLSEIDSNLAVIVEVDNGLFKAYGYAYNQAELEEFNHPDGRPKRWFTMPLTDAKKLSGYNR